MTLKYQFEKITANNDETEVTVSKGILPGVVHIVDSAGKEFTTKAKDIHLLSQTIKTLERYNGYLTPQTEESMPIKIDTGE